jgi:hypothetical protein
MASLVLVIIAISLGLRAAPGWTLLACAVGAVLAWGYQRHQARALRSVAPALGCAYQRAATLEDIDIFGANFAVFREGVSATA